MPERKYSTADLTLPGQGDHIRIVPPNIPSSFTEPLEKVVVPSSPTLIYNGGPLIEAVEVFNIYWGSAWGNEPLTTLAGDVNKYFQFILTSDLLKQMSEYSVQRYSIGPGRYLGTITITMPDLHQGRQFMTTLFNTCYNMK